MNKKSISAGPVPAAAAEKAEQNVCPSAASGAIASAGAAPLAQAVADGLTPDTNTENSPLLPAKSAKKRKTASAKSPATLVSVSNESAVVPGPDPARRASLAPAKKRKTTSAKRRRTRAVPQFRPQYSEQLLAFFDVAPFKVTEVTKKDGSISLLETAAELPTFAAFARSLGVTQQVLLEWEEQEPSFAEAAKKARDLQGDILIQNSLRGNYSASFAMFTAKNILGWSDGKNEPASAPHPLIVRWEK